MEVLLTARSGTGLDDSEYDGSGFLVGLWHRVPQADINMTLVSISLPVPCFFHQLCLGFFLRMNPTAFVRGAVNGPCSASALVFLRGLIAEYVFCF